MSSKSIKETLKEAKSLIDERRYEEAYRVLETIGDHPKAQDWMIKLGVLMEKESGEGAYEEPVSTGESADEPRKRKITDVPIINPEDLQRKKEAARNPNHEPRSPLTLLFLSVVVHPVIAATLLGQNWNRMGRPQWSAPTIVTSVALLGLLICTFVIGIRLVPALPAPGSEMVVVQLYALVVGIIFSLSFGFNVFIALLQEQAMSGYRRVKGKRALADHLYRPAIPALITAVPVLIAAVALAYFFNSFMSPRSYSLQEVTTYVPSSWQPSECLDLSSCVFRFEHDANYEFAMVTLYRVPPGEWESLAAMETATRAQMDSEFPDLMHSTRDTTINGNPAIIRETLFRGEVCDAISGDVFIQHSDMVYVYNMFADCAIIWERRSREMQYIITHMEIG